jgi:hypothetical protein
MATLEDGINTRPSVVSKPKLLDPKPIEFVPFRKSTTLQKPEFVAVAGNVVFAKKMHAVAMDSISQGKAVTVFRFTYTSLYHKRFFDTRGYWVQTGGLFGRSHRTQSLFWIGGLQKRVNMEIKNLSGQRLFADVKTVKIF